MVSIWSASPISKNKSDTFALTYSFGAANETQLSCILPFSTGSFTRARLRDAEVPAPVQKEGGGVTESPSAFPTHNLVLMSTQIVL